MNTRSLSKIANLMFKTLTSCTLLLVMTAGCGTTAGGGGGWITAFDGLGGDGTIGDATGGEDTPGADATTGEDAKDATTADAPLEDAVGVDTQVKDTLVADTGPKDSGPLDTGPKDTGPIDTGPTDTGPDCSKTDYTKVQSILTQNCNGCHGHQFGSGCSYATGSKSSIKSKVNSGSMPPGGMPSAADKALVVKWVNDGALCTPAPGCP